MSLAKSKRINESDTIQIFSKRLTKAQGAIRILNSVCWTDNIQNQFFRSGAKEMPNVNEAWYQTRPLEFNSLAVRNEFTILEHDLTRTLGKQHPACAIMLRMCREYKMVIQMLEQRGKPEFGKYSRELFGSSKDALYSDNLTLADFGRKIKAALIRIEPCMRTDDPDDAANISGKDAAVILQESLAKSMSNHRSRPTVVFDDGIISDAAAGADKIKLREDALFSRRELRLLEVHEGWVHVGTTLNGHAQSICRFLSKGTPSATITQEGLAVLVEILAFTSSPARQHRINNRVLAVEMAENGANFLEVYRFFVDQGFSELSSYQFTVRVFRGSTPEGPPFTKDISYTKGFILLYNFLRAAINTGKLDFISLLFCGKTTLEDIGNIHQLYCEGILQAPVFVPPQFTDLHGLSAWMCYDTILSEFNNEAMQHSYMNLLE